MSFFACSPVISHIFLEISLDLSEITLLAILFDCLIGIILMCQQITLIIPIFLTTNLTDYMKILLWLRHFCVCISVAATDCCLQSWCTAEASAGIGQAIRRRRGTDTPLLHSTTWCSPGLGSLQATRILPSAAKTILGSLKVHVCVQTHTSEHTYAHIWAG